MENQNINNAELPKEIKSELGKVAECYAILTDGIDRTIDIQPKTKSHREYER